MRRKWVLIFCVFTFFFPEWATATSALETVRVNVNKVLEILRDPTRKSQFAKEIKEDRIRPVFKEMFDDVELSKRTLGRNWTSLNSAQQEEFVTLFRRILENAYADKILSYTNEQVVFDREVTIAPNRAEVYTRVITSSKQIPVVYRVIFKDGTWKVYDVVIENVSLVQNYRSQFNDILSKETPEKLLETMRKKLQEKKA
ncbi:MAG: ABC transporter substrate-binding protein [Syntrophales bacterium]|nr:ABC transporter substrate-binding protein [Syntrophales bacterium]